MAERFVLTAQLQLQAPRNVRQVVSNIQSQLQNVSIDVEVKNAEEGIVALMIEKKDGFIKVLIKARNLYALLQIMELGSIQTVKKSRKIKIHWRPQLRRKD